MVTGELMAILRPSVGVALNRSTFTVASDEGTALYLGLYPTPVRDIPHPVYPPCCPDFNAF